MVLRLLIWTALWTAACKATAQEQRHPFYRLFSRENGLPDHSVYDIEQDSQGFIWLASNRGLCRYDGYEFKQYPLPDKRSPSGSHILADDQGRVWYMTFDGYLYYKSKTGDTLTALAGQKTPSGYFPFGKSKNRLLVLQAEGIDVFSLDDLTLLRSVFIPNLKHDFVTSLSLNDKFYLWLADGYLYELDDTSTAPRRRAWDASTLRLPNETRGLLFDYRGALHRTERYSESFSEANANLSLPPYRLPGKYFIQNIVSTGQDVWFCTPNGALHWQNPGQPCKLYYPMHNITCVLHDRENNYWFGTANEGLMFVPNLSNRFIYNTKDEINRMVRRGDTLLVGTKKNALKKILLDQGKEKTLLENPVRHDIYFIHWDTLRQEIVFSSDALYSLNPKTGKATRSDIAVKDFRPLDDCYAACTWSGGFGLYKYEGNCKKSSIWDSLYQSLEKNKIPYLVNYRSIVQGVRGKSLTTNAQGDKVYFVSGTGLFAMTPRGWNPVLYQGQPIILRRVYAVGNRIFAQSSAGELLGWSSDRDSISEIPLIINNQKQKVLSVKTLDSLLVVFSDRHLFFALIDSDTPRFTAIDIGIPPSGVEDVELWNNRFLMCYKQGILQIDLDSLQKIEKPRLVVNRFSAEGILLDPAFYPELKYYQNDIEINYSILSFNTGGDYPLYYKINNEDWKRLPSESRSLRLAALAPGDYKLTFRLGDDEHLGTSAIAFRIIPAFWQTSWFSWLMFAIAMSISYLYYRWQTGLLRQKSRLTVEKVNLQRQLDRSILTAIRSQMNPHFFFNALNTIQAYIFLGDKKNASTYLSKFSKLTRRILEMSELDAIPLSEELDALRLYMDLEKARLNDELIYEIEINENLSPASVKIPTMILQPYLENAIKHGLLHKQEGEKRLWLRLKKEGDWLLVEIEDNGIGRERSEALRKQTRREHRSFAGQANLTRIEILNKGNNNIGLEYTDKKDEQGQPCGTLVKIRIPL